MLGAGALFFSRDAHALVLKPIERMVKKVREVSENPLKRFAVDDKSDESDGDADDDAHFAERREDGKGRACVQETRRFSRDGFARRRTRQVLNGRASVKKSSRRYRDDSQMETRLFENSIAKICGLLAVGFGEAGSEIIAANIRARRRDRPDDPGQEGGGDLRVLRHTAVHGHHRGAAGGRDGVRQHHREDRPHGDAPARRQRQQKRGRRVSARLEVPGGGHAGGRRAPRTRPPDAAPPSPRCARARWPPSWPSSRG